MTDEWISESKLAAGLMPSETLRDRIRELRREHLFEGDDFRLHKKEVQYSRSGVEKLMDLLNVNTALEGATEPSMPDGVSVMGDAEKTAPALNAPVCAIVKRVWQNNPHYFQATLAGEDITVCVRESKNFAQGMEIPTEQLARRSQFSQIYDFVGRCPRGRGKW